MLRKILFIVGGVVVLLVVAVLVGPSFVDWNQYKPQIAAEVEKATGRTLSIDGDLSLSILPAPTLTAEGVRFANIEGGSAADMMTLEALDVRVAFMPLLSGDVQVTSVALVKPTILLEKLADGSANWEIQPAGDADAPASDTGETDAAETDAAETDTGETDTGAADTAPAGSGGMQIGIDKVTIENGTLIYIDHAAGSEQRVESLNAEIAAPTLQGPFSLEGDAIAAGFPLGFDISTGRIVEAEPIDLSLDLTLDEDAASLRFGGTVATGEQIAVDGTLAGEASDLGAVMVVLGGASTPALEGKAFELSGTVVSTQSDAESAIRMDDLEVQLGDMTATGAFEATLGETMAVVTTLKMGRIDADALIEAFGGTADDADDDAEDGTGETAAFALPSGIDAAVDLSIDAVTLKGGVVNQVRLVAHLLPEGMLTIERFNAQMPGGSNLSLAGDVAPAEGVPSFAGVLEASSDNLRGLMSWLGVEAAGVPNDRLRNLTLASRVTASPGQIQLGEIDMRLDNSKIQGGVVIALPNANRSNPAFGVGLAVDQINLDAYMPPPGTDEASEGEGGADNPLGGLAPLADINANVELRVGSLTLNGQQIEGLHLDGTLDGGTLTLRDLSVSQFAGGSGTVTGTITELAGAPRFDTRIDLDVADATRAMQTAGMADAPAGLGRMTLAGTLAGGAEDVAYDLAFTIAGIGAEGSATGTAAGLGGGIPRIDTDFSLDAADAGPLFAIAGVPVPEGANLGALSLSGTAESGDDDLTYDVKLALTGAGTTGTFAGTVTDLSGTPRVDTTLDLQAGDPSLLLALAGVEAAGVETLGALGLAGSLAGNSDDMTLDVDLTAMGGSASIAGTVAAGETSTALDLTLSADHPELKQLLAALSPDLGASATGVGPLKFSGAIDGTTDNFTISDLDLTAGVTHVTGNAAVDMTTARPQFTATLNGDTVDVTPFMGPGGDGGGGGGDGEQWSSEPIDLSALDSADGTIDLKAAAFIAGETRIDNLDARTILKDGVLTFERMTGNVYGGAFDLTGTRITARGTPAARIRAIANGLDSSELISGGLLGATFDGPVSFTGNFDTQGASMAELMNQLDGTGNVDGSIQVLTSTQQAIGSALIGILGQQVEQVRGITDVMNAVFSAFTGRANSLTGDFVVTDGVLQTDNTRFANEAASLLAQGTADIGAWSMDMLAEIYRQQSGDLPFMVLDLTGPMSGPNVALNRSDGGTGEPTGLIEQLFPGGENAVGEDLSTEDAVENLLQGVIPGLGTDEDADADADAEPLDPSAPGAAGLTVPETDGTETEATEPGAIAPEDEPAAEASEEIVEEPAAEETTEEPVVEEPAAEEMTEEEPGAIAPADEEPEADKSEETMEEPAVADPDAEEPTADETSDQAPGASGVTAEPEAAPAEEPATEEPAAEESTRETVEEPAAEPGATIAPEAEPETAPVEEPLPEEEDTSMAPGAAGVEPGAEPVSEGDGEEPTINNLLQGILGTEQQ